jgi:signal transduction histidine kinase
MSMLHQFVAANREELIHRCRTKVRARSVPVPTPAELDHGIPQFLDELVVALASRGLSNPAIDATAARHGRDLQLMGFTVSQVVHDYGDVCQSITDLAVEIGAPISVEDFRTLNQCLDDAIASAVTSFGRTDATTRSAAESEIEGEPHAFGIVAHELRNLLNTAMLAFEVLQTGNVGVRGSTGDVLKRSLTALRDITNRSIAEVRLLHAATAESIAVAGLVEEVAAAAALDAANRGLRFSVQPGEGDVVVLGDRQVVAAIVTNLVQNAFKYTRPLTSVSLCATSTPGHVTIEVADECGGLDCDAEDLFGPFERRHADRTGLGLGLAFSRRGAAAHGGCIRVRNVPEHGCVFGLELPRVPAAQLSTAGAS